MPDRDRLLDLAAESLRAGRPDDCDDVLRAFAAELARRPPDAAERARCEARLSRLRRLAGAALAGLDQARTDLRGMIAAAGALDVYDRGGRQRVPTGIGERVRRF